MNSDSCWLLVAGDKRKAAGSGHWVMDQADKLRLMVGQAAPETIERVGNDVPLVVVTGARASVGATTVALNLAAVLADRGERVLLLDGALRRGETGDSILPRRRS